MTQDDILDITDKLHEDFRFKALDRLDPDRKLMLFQVIDNAVGMNVTKKASN